MVNVTHDGHHRWTRLHQLWRVGRIIEAFNHVGFRNALDLVAHFLGDELCGIRINHVVDLCASGPASSGSG